MTLFIQCDPHNYDRDTLWRQALVLCQAFCEENAIEAPRIVTRTRTQHHGYWTSEGRIVVNLERCLPPTKTPAYAWSFPGYKADLTVAGVLAHELGHHAEDDSGITARDWRVYTNGEPPPTSYAPNWHEDFAESMKIFVLNPDLLRIGRPRRYEALAAVFTPTVQVSWQEVLKFAHPRYTAAVASWARCLRRYESNV